jgi:hypothetical protein
VTDRNDEPTPHYCPEWDFAIIRPGDPEMEACLCYMGPTTPKPEPQHVHERGICVECYNRGARDMLATTPHGYQEESPGLCICHCPQENLIHQSGVWWPDERGVADGQRQG